MTIKGNVLNKLKLKTLSFQIVRLHIIYFQGNKKYFSFGVNSNLYGRPMSPQLFEGYAHKMLWIHGLSWNILNTVLRQML